MTTLFRSTGRKVTPQRQRIFHVLHGNERHPTAEGVYADIIGDMPTVSLRTVYQTLAELTELGEINKIDLGTGSARFDPNVEAHHHLVCDDCGAIRDVTANTTDHSHSRTQARCCHRLVGPLASVHRRKGLPEHRFSRARQPLRTRHQVHVQAANHHYICLHVSTLIR